MEIKKLFCVTLTSREDWDSPEILFVRTSDRDKALGLALAKLSTTIVEHDEMVASGEFDSVVIEVEDIIEDDGVVNEPDPEITGCPDCGADDIENLGFNYDTAEIEHECKNCEYRGNRDNFLLIEDE
jgi:hypothetical protein